MNANKDLNYAFTTSRQCMRLLGIWPDPNVPLNVFHRSKVGFMLAMCIMSLYVFTPQVINVIRAWGNVSRMVEFFVAANFSLMALCKLIITRYHGEKLRMIIASIMTDWMTSKSQLEQKTMLKLARSGRSLSFGYFVIVIGTLIAAYYAHIGSIFRNIHQSRRYLIYRFDYIQKSPNYEITYFIQLCGGTYAIFSNYSVDSFISILLLHMCAQLINLRTTLNNLIDELNNKPISSWTFRKGLAAIIIRHEYLIRSTKTIDDCYSPVLFVHMLSATFQLCLVTFQIFTMITDNLDVSFIKIMFFAFYILLVLIQLYIYCYAAERLLTESTNMAYGVYGCKWYNISAKNAKDLMFIVYRSAISLKLTAGKFGNFSLELFGIAVKTSMGYLSALLTIRE
ncbi:odorant receptor 13a [Camponotus floridanus]|uniref:odorant receptor 13a n=1 Tax=Camponotus floridanus TaxID=104421 RepID=UPI000DC6BE30|nr:odorant receptor 13a [Camponotus floridanus]